jgi:serralysin
MQHDASGLRDLYAFNMGANQVASIALLGAVGQDWQADGTGDFNGDGFKDILLERIVNNKLELDVLGIANGAVQSVNVSGVLPPNGFSVDGIGDFNKDHIDDILIHYDDGAGRHLLTLNQGNYTTQSIATVVTVGAEWNIAGMGDFNGDGYADILIHTDTTSARDFGILINQAGNGWVFRDLGPIVGKNVQIDGIGDFNGDGTADISFHYNPTGDIRTDAYFEMHNAAITAIHTTGSVGHEWIVT